MGWLYEHINPDGCLVTFQAFRLSPVGDRIINTFSHFFLVILMAHATGCNARQSTEPAFRIT